MFVIISEDTDGQRAAEERSGVSQGTAESGKIKSHLKKWDLGSEEEPLPGSPVEGNAAKCLCVSVCPCVCVHFFAQLGFIFGARHTHGVKIVLGIELIFVQCKMN